MAKNAENENFRNNSISYKILDFTINRCKIICSDALGDVLSNMACLAVFFEYFVLSWKFFFLKKSWFFQKKMWFFFRNSQSQNHEKKFHVKLEKPIKRNQKGRVFKLQYDWEEPDRIFEYVLSSQCKKFIYSLSVPKNLNIKNRILEVEKELGLKKRADPPAKIQYMSDKTKVTWETDKTRTLNKHETFEFHW